jgi:hypothetical protein
VSAARAYFRAGLAAPRPRIYARRFIPTGRNTAADRRPLRTPTKHEARDKRINIEIIDRPVRIDIRQLSIAIRKRGCVSCRIRQRQRRLRLSLGAHRQICASVSSVVRFVSASRLPSAISVSLPSLWLALTRRRQNPSQIAQSVAKSGILVTSKFPAQISRYRCPRRSAVGRSPGSGRVVPVSAVERYSAMYSARSGVSDAPTPTRMRSRSSAKGGVPERCPLRTSE